MDEAHRALARWWSATGNLPAAAEGSGAAVEAIERRYGLSMPDDFRNYLLHAAPAEDFWDDEDAIWWPPQRIRGLPFEYEHPVRDPRIAARAATYLFFADFMLWCWAWAICCDDGEDRGKIALIGGSPDRWVADSFTDFVSAYIADPRSVS